jgi:hypothetical protein
MDTIKVEPASDEETDTMSSVHDFLQINIKSEYSVAVEADESDIKVCSVLNKMFYGCVNSLSQEHSLINANLTKKCFFWD